MVSYIPVCVSVKLSEAPPLVEGVVVAVVEPAVLVPVAARATVARFLRMVHIFGSIDQIMISRFIRQRFRG